MNQHILTIRISIIFQWIMEEDTRLYMWLFFFPYPCQF